MQPPLKGNVLVTGTSSGIGREIARQLAGTAQVLILVARRAERLEELKREIEALGTTTRVLVRACDITDQAAAEAMLESVQAEAGPIDVLINNAGMGDIGLLEVAPWEKLEAMIATNITALTHLTHRLIPGMVARGRGGVLNVSSGFGLTVLPGVAAYAATKHYVTALTEGLRMELRGTGVVISQVCPGPVATEFESLAGNPTGMQVPSFIQLSPESCARRALYGFSRGRAMILPGFFMTAGALLDRLAPRALKRLFFAPAAVFLRRNKPQGITVGAPPQP